MQEQETGDDLPNRSEHDCIPPAYLQTREWRETGDMRRWRNMMYTPLMGCPPLIIPWLRVIGSHRRTVNEEGAHAKRSVTR
jgi:hypothetical protein